MQFVSLGLGLVAMVVIVAVTIKYYKRLKVQKAKDKERGITDAKGGLFS